MSRTGELFDTILERMGIRTDAQLAEALDIEPPNLSRLRQGHRPITDAFILCLHEVSGMPVSEIKMRLDVPALPRCEACRVPSKAQALVQHVVKQFVVGARSQGVKTSA